MSTLPNQKMEQAVQLLFFDQLSDKQIAAKCGISNATLYTWKNKPEFQEALRNYGAQLRNQSYALLESGSDKAVKTLLVLLDSDNEQIRLKASTELLRLIKVENPPELQENNNTQTEINNFLTVITQQINQK